MLSNVRLGEFDTSTAIDCDNTTFYTPFCAPAAVDIAIGQIILHENYNPLDENKHNDIALIRLKEEVTFTIYISPICLPLEESLSADNLAGVNMTAAGWGATETAKSSDQKLKVTLKVWTNDECSKTYIKKNIKPQQFCAGGQGRKGLLTKN